MTEEQQKRCRKCKYAKNFSSHGIYCDYLLMTLRRRPCKIDGCTEFVPQKRTPPRPRV